MARKRRNEKSMSELVFGALAFLVVCAVISPNLRALVFSTLASIVSLLIIMGIIGYAIYLLIQALKEKKDPVPTWNRNSSRFYVKPPETYTENSFDQSTDINPIQPLSWDISILRDIEWKRFEIVCTEFLKLAGFTAKETNIGADGGVDIRICKPGIEKFDGIVQCKAWNTYKVGVKPVRELFGVMAAERVSTGIFMTSGVFTSEAEEFAKGKITLISGDSFISLIVKRSVDDQQALLDVALEGDYKTPTCPQCDIKMTLRESSKGKNAGGQFWGCVKYPRCKHTFIYKEA